ncbi:MAG: class I SAM-dependent methyltransferase [Actinomycetota bacterium]
MPDWGLGRYELTAAELEPVARWVVAMAAPLRDERVLDIACGTGNAAILAGRFKSKVIGLDQARRLIEVAGQRAAAEGLDIRFVVGNAEELGFPDESFEVALSIFGLIFASDPQRAFAEMVRVMTPRGRAFFTVWMPGGAIDSFVNVCMKYVHAAAGQSAPPPRFAWHDEAVVQDLASRHRATVRFHEGELQFLDDSPEDFLRRNQQNHPMSVATRPLLEEAGSLEAMEKESLAALRAGNEDPHKFRVTSRYRVVEVRR